MSGFEVGQAVECIDDKHGPFRKINGWILLPDLDGLTRGRIYTIRRVGTEHVTGTPAVWLKEIVRHIKYDEPEEPGFLARRFRPLPDERLDVFRSLLEPTPEQVLVVTTEDNLERLDEVARAIGDAGTMGA